MSKKSEDISSQLCPSFLKHIDTLATGWKTIPITSPRDPNSKGLKRGGYNAVG